MSEGTRDGNRVKSVSRLFDIVESLRELDGARVTELATHLDVPKSTVHGYLSTMTAAGYAVKRGDEYHLGLRFVGVGEHARTGRQAYRFAEPLVEQLAAETDERAQFIAAEHGRGVFVHRATGDHAVETDTRVGKRVYLHSTGAGKAILAQFPPDRVDAVVERHGLPQRTPNTITDGAALREELATIRERGVAFNDEEGTVGLRSVAAPVTAEGGVVGALSVSGPSHRLKGELFREELPDTILGSANELELRLTYA
jgi:DNA-binding IclR family transcriptional regulator